MKIISLKIKDFLSVGEVFLSFPDSGLVLVEGWNHDTGSANGAGKSSILSAISWCLYGKIPRDVTSSSIVKDGCKGCSVSVEIDINNSVFNITRTRPNSLKITKDGVERTVDQQELEKLLKISYDKYLNIAYSAQGLGARFLDLSDTEKKQLFLDMSRVEDYSSAKTYVDLKIKAINESKRTLQSNILQLNSRLDEISNNSLEVGNIEDKIKEALLEIKDLKDKISIIDLVEPDISRHKGLKLRLKNELNTISEAKGEIKQLNVMINKLKLPQKDVETHSCPHCLNPVIISDKSLMICDIDSIKIAKEKLNDKNNKQIQEAMLEIDRLTLFISKEPKVLDTLLRCENQMEEIRRDFLLEKDRLKNLTYNLQSVNQSLANLNKDKASAEASLERASKLKKEIEVSTYELHKKEEQLAIAEASSHALSPAGIQAYILDSILEQFNSCISSLLSEGWPNLSYELLSFKENKSGAISTRFSDQIKIDAVSRSLGALSGGERRCLSIVIDLALIKIFELYSGFIPSPIILDEPFDHMDCSNRERAISILQSFSDKSLIMIVDHQNETKGLFDKIIHIEKRNQTTSAIME